MTQFVMCSLIFFVGLVPASLLADDFRLAMKATSGGKSANGAVEQPLAAAPKGAKTIPAAPARSTIARPSLTVSPKQLANVSWEVQDTSATTEFKDLLVHFLVIREERPGQREV